MITAEKQQALEERMDRLGIQEDDLVEKFVLGSGSGGQKINKTHSCVYLRHLPTGFEVKCQSGRSRTMNRYIARGLICDQIEERRRLRALRRKRAAAKSRALNRKPSAATKAKRVEQKRRRSAVKRMRSKPTTDD